MAKFFRGLSDFWNKIMNEMGRVISAYNPTSGELFDKLKDFIASILGKTAEAAENYEAK